MEALRKKEQKRVVEELKKGEEEKEILEALTKKKEDKTETLLCSICCKLVKSKSGLKRHITAKHSVSIGAAKKCVVYHLVTIHILVGLRYIFLL